MAPIVFVVMSAPLRGGVHAPVAVALTPDGAMAVIRSHLADQQDNINGSSDDEEPAEDVRAVYYLPVPLMGKARSSKSKSKPGRKAKSKRVGSPRR